MKRLNPATNQPFKRGDVREDGYLFKGYITTRIKKDGFFIEEWLKPESMANYISIVKCGQKEWYKENAEAKKAKSTKWAEENRIKSRAFKAKWKKNNRDIENTHNAKRRAAKLKRTPKWVKDQYIDEIKVIYRRAALIKQFTGEEYHVDHIIPMQGKNVSGLHVPWNLQLLPAIENVKKSNKFDI